MLILLELTTVAFRFRCEELTRRVLAERSLSGGNHDTLMDIKSEILETEPAPTAFDISTVSEAERTTVALVLCRRTFGDMRLEIGSVRKPIFASRYLLPWNPSDSTHPR